MEIAQDRSGDALYRTGYLCISLPFPIQKNISAYSVQEFGTFIHEYVHFLQNMTTPWGMYEAARLYEQITYFVTQLKSDVNPIIYAPVDEDYKISHERVLQILHIGRGADKDSLGREVYHLRFADETNFKYNISFEESGICSVPKVQLTFDTKEHGRAEILFGAWTIKESMAALIQEKYDPTSPRRHADVPYNIINRFVGDCFPNISENKPMMIAICYASLFSLSPALTFIEQATKANEANEMTWQKLLEDYFNRKVKTDKGCYSFAEFYCTLSDKFLTVAQKLLLSDKLSYIPIIINASQLANNVRPLLCFVEGRPTSADIEQIMSITGMPAIIGKGDMGIFPSKENDEASQSEIVLLLGYETIYKYLTSANLHCPRLSQCTDAGKVQLSCNNTPWDREDPCPMSEVARLLDIQDKHIIKK